MEIKFAKNRVTIAFQISLIGSENVNTYNNILSIASKYNAQVNIYKNTPAFVKNAKEEDVPQMGSFGGSVTFHDHSCSSREDYKVLFNYLHMHANNVKYSTEIEVTHHEDGTPYKIPQIVIVDCDSNGNVITN